MKFWNWYMILFLYGLAFGCSQEEKYIPGPDRNKEGGGICGKPYKNVLVSCYPRLEKFGNPKEAKTPKEIGEGCKKYIDATAKTRTKGMIMCSPKDPTWCMDVYFSYACHQMLSGQLTIDGQGSSYPSEFVFRKAIK